MHYSLLGTHAKIEYLDHWKLCIRKGLDYPVLNRGSDLVYRQFPGLSIHGSECPLGRLAMYEKIPASFWRLDSFAFVSVSKSRLLSVARKAL